MRTSRVSTSARGARVAPQSAPAPRARATRRARAPADALPAFIEPQVAVRAATPPQGERWLHEIAFDGERVLARRAGGRVRLFTSAGDDCTARFPAIARAVEALDVGDAWLDGEAVTLGDGSGEGSVRYALFDAMFLDAEDLRERPLDERRARLARALDSAQPPLVYSQELAGDGASLLREAGGLGVAGLIAKRRDAPYRSGPSRAWLELECASRGDGNAGEPARLASASHDEASVAGVRITNPDRPISHGDGATKLDVARYHDRMAPLLLREIARRPLALVRCTGGDLAQCFFQKHVKREQGNAGDPESPYARLPTRRALIEAVQSGAFEFHTWGSSVPRLDRPDRITLDLDPDADLAWPAFREAAGYVRALLDELGLRWFLKTTGGKGLHFVLPIERRYSWDAVKLFAAGIARRLAATQPDVFTATMSKAERAGRVFVDYLRNAEGATAVAAYGLRARPGLPVSMPIEWDALANDVRGTHFNWRNAADFVAARARDPWVEYDAARQRIPPAAVQALEG